MKFNYSNFPVLEKLDKGIFGVIGINPDHLSDFQFDSERGGKVMFRDTFKRNIPYFKSSIKYIAKSLDEAIIASKSKLLTPEINMKISSCSGTILGYNGFQYCYNIISEEGSDKWEFVFYAFNKDVLMAFLTEYNGKIYAYTYEGYKKLEDIDRAKKIFTHLILILNFIKYAEIETKIALPNRPIFEGINCLYNNKSKHPIEIIDSTWFTTFIKSDAFKVRGHFRLQPCGEGLKDRKLIWINEFQKEGYTREAKKPQETI
jgi:hypothetical protein